MGADEPPGQSSSSDADQLSEADRYSTLSVIDGLRLVRAFSTIERAEDRKRIIDLANQMSNNRV